MLTKSWSESYSFRDYVSPHELIGNCMVFALKGIFSRLLFLTGDALEKKIDELLQAMRSADPAELENIKSIIRKKVRFFDRMSLAAMLLKIISEGKRESDRGQRRVKNERPEKKAEPQTKPQETKEKAERVIPEGAKTLYLNIGKMKHLYAKDLSKLLQNELEITREDIYQIRVHDKYSFVTMSAENCEKAIAKLNNQAINGRTAKVTYSEK